MGFSANGMSSLRMNHGMLSSRGSTFKKYRKYINVGVNYVQVDVARMERLSAEARRSASIKLIAVIVVLTMIFMAISLL